MTASRLIQAITGKNVVFITVKNRKYIRVSQIECSLFWYRTSPSGNRHNPQGLCSYSGKGLVRMLKMCTAVGSRKQDWDLE